MNSSSDFSGDYAKQLVAKEKEINQLKDDFKEKYPGALDALNDIQVAEDEAVTLKAKLKVALEAEDDYDIHTCGERKYSLSKVAKLSVKDINLVPEAFKSIMAVADEKKAQGHYKLYGTPPSGFEDRSYTKLNWKDA